MSDKKLPWNELSGESNLDGTYKVTFLFDVKEDDGVTVGHIHEALASSLAGDPVLNKLAKLDLEKTDKEGNTLPEYQPFKVGELVSLKEDIEIESDLEYSNGYYIIGAKDLSVEKLGRVKITVPKGSKAIVNQIAGNKLELIDFDSAVILPFTNYKTSEKKNVHVNLDSIIILNKYVEKVEDEE